MNIEAVRAGGYRLPTRAEWEYVCRAGTTTEWYCGDSEDPIGYYEWYGPNAGQNAGYHARRCGTRLPNELGFFDLMGNVIEWCHDRHEDVGPVPESLVRDDIAAEPIGRDDRDIRGGSFGSPPADLRSSSPGWFRPSNGDNHIGFRVARTIP